jgi:GNAT superfamily N-acetyltransferase
MLFRTAETSDIVEMMAVRMSVNENVLATPGLIIEKDYEEYIHQRGRGWVCETKGVIAGFSVADAKGHNIWALFVRPEFEGVGIGRNLHAIMLDWYFTQTDEKVWLGTASGTRAETFYRRAGWKENGKHGKGEIKFEMSYHDWKQLNHGHL